MKPTTKIKNISEYLSLKAKEFPNRIAVAQPISEDKYGRNSYTHLTFKQLDEDSSSISRGLIKIGLGPGKKIVLMIPPSIEFFLFVFAIFKSGSILVGIDAGIEKRYLKKCLNDVKPDAFIGITKAHLARVLLRWCPKVKTIINLSKKSILSSSKSSIIGLLNYGKNNLSKNPFGEINKNDLAGILFTSGSTGIPKGVEYIHSNFLKQVKILKNVLNLTKNEIDLCTFPLFALFAPALGMTSIIPKMDFTKPALINPENLKKIIFEWNVTNIFGSPALINTFSRYGLNQNWKFPSLKRVFSAGAPVPIQVIETMLQLMPENTQVFTPYGSTECLPVSIIGSDEILNLQLEETFKGTCIGYPIGCEIKIIKIVDDVIKSMSDVVFLPKNEIGEIIVKGKQVTRGYLFKSQTELSKIYEEEEGEGFWHRMGDCGFIDNNNRIWFCGRKSQRIILNNDQTTLFTIPIENKFNSHPGIYRSALIPFKESSAIVLQLEDGFDFNTSKLIEPFPNIKKVFFKENFPVDIRHNSKINRNELAFWAKNKKKIEIKNFFLLIFFLLIPLILPNFLLIFLLIPLSLFYKVSKYRFFFYGILLKGLIYSIKTLMNVNNLSTFKEL